MEGVPEDLREAGRRTQGYRIGFVSLLAALIGILAGFIAYLLYHLIGFFTNLVFYGQLSFRFLSPTPDQVHHLGPWVIGIPVLGAIVVGFMVKYGSKKIEGHGIPEAMEAVVASRSRIEPKVAILKPLSAAIAIGTGGPFGAEGPIIQTGGAFGSLIGQMISMTAAERRVLLACGAGAGMAATFSTPIAGVIVAIELLLLEFRSRSFIPLVISSVMATGIRFWLIGRQPMFTFTHPADFGVPGGLPWYLLLGAICGIAAVYFTRFLYWVEDLFDRLPIDDLWHPAIGALGLGIIGFFVPRVLGVGYNWIGDILNNQFTLKVLLILLVAKALALVISLSSGTSGGLLAPMFMSSAALGGAFAMGVNRLAPGAHLDPGAYALVAMGAIFGAAARSTFAFIVFAFEITRDYNAILPLMLVAVIADGIAIRYLPHSIMTEKLARRGVEPELDYQADVLKHVRVSDVMRTSPVTVPPEITVRELADLLSRDPRYGQHRGLPIVDAEGKLVGVVTQGDLLRALRADPSGSLTVDALAGGKPVIAYPDERVFDALFRMLQNNIGRLPVVARDDPRKLVGMIGRPNVLSAWTRQLEEEYQREHGWLNHLRSGGQPDKKRP
ncbi:MAG TPA: chloride channel protein [Candidatus Acidoferrales bacterium]|nr:chloride channel protein [Candidatus Acidoferrales bacterium]